MYARCVVCSVIILKCAKIARENELLFEKMMERQNSAYDFLSLKCTFLDPIKISIESLQPVVAINLALNEQRA